MTLVQHRNTGRKNPNGSSLQPGTSLVSSSRPRIIDITDDHLAGMHRYRSNERTRSPTCLRSSYKPPGAECQAQQDHNVNNESGFYSLENGPSKRNQLETAAAASSAGLGRWDAGFVRRGLQALAVTRAPSNPVHGHSEVSGRKVPSRFAAPRLSNGRQHLPHSRLFLASSVFPRCNACAEHRRGTFQYFPKPLALHTNHVAHSIQLVE